MDPEQRDTILESSPSFTLERVFRTRSYIHIHTARVTNTICCLLSVPIDHVYFLSLFQFQSTIHDQLGALAIYFLPPSAA